MAARTTAYVALLRGINVGGHRKVPMKDLRALVEEAGGTNVATYVQSGNVVLTSTASADGLRDDLEQRLEQTFGFDVAVMVRSLAEMKTIVAKNPYGHEADDPTKVFVVFLGGTVKDADLTALDPAAFAPDEFVGRENEVYLHLPNGAGRSKLAGSIERKVKVPATVRNWRTVTALLDMATAASKAS